jgi:DM4/DM12 family
LLQFIAGFGIPVDLEPESLTIGYVFKAQYFLPYNVTQLYPSRLERDIKVDEYGKAYETYDVDVEVKSVDDANAVRDDGDGVRWSIYQVLEILVRKQMKVDGRQCVLRAICEMSQLPFTFESGLLGELLHIFFM